MARILVVEAEQEVRTLIADLLTDAGYKVDGAAHGAEALARLEASAFDLILSDLTMPAIEGIALYWEIVRRWPQLTSRLVYVTGAIKAGSVDYRVLLAERVPRIIKPFHPERLLDVVTRALAQNAP